MAAAGAGSSCTRTTGAVATRTAGGLAATAGASPDVPTVGDAIATGDVTTAGGNGSPGTPTGLSVGLSGLGDAAMSG